MVLGCAPDAGRLELAIWHHAPSRRLTREWLLLEVPVVTLARHVVPAGDRRGVRLPPSITEGLCSAPDQLPSHSPGTARARIHLCDLALSVASPHLGATAPPRRTARCRKELVSVDSAQEKSGREDLNLRPHGPEPCALTGLRYAPFTRIIPYVSRLYKRVQMRYNQARIMPL
jgi:hypothetical protein